MWSFICSLSWLIVKRVYLLLERLRRRSDAFQSQVDRRLAAVMRLMFEAVVDDGFPRQRDSWALNFLFQLVGVHCFNAVEHEVITFHHELGQPGFGF